MLQSFKNLSIFNIGERTFWSRSSTISYHAISSDKASSKATHRTSEAKKYILPFTLGVIVAFSLVAVIAVIQSVVTGHGTTTPSPVCKYELPRISATSCPALIQFDDSTNTTDIMGGRSPVLSPIFAVD